MFYSLFKRVTKLFSKMFYNLDGNVIIIDHPMDNLIGVMIRKPATLNADGFRHP